MRHLMSPLDFSVEELDHLLDLAHDIELHPFDSLPDRSRKKAVSSADGSGADSPHGVHCSTDLQLSDEVYYADHVLCAVLCGHGCAGIERKIVIKKTGIPAGFTAGISVFLCYVGIYFSSTT